VPFTALISDLHLTAARPAINRAFFSFLEGPAREADALYILGDLFDYWAGDDDLSDPLNAQVAAAIRGLTTAGVPVLIMHGNRDFLLFDGFSDATGSRLIEDPTIVDLYGTRTLLMHGDTLCTDDRRYQAFRRRVRRRLWQRLFLVQPLWLRRAELQRARGMSETQKRAKPESIMDVTPAAVEQAFRDSGAARMIHGHTHRPARHLHRVDSRDYERWVLPDWYERGRYLRVSPDGWSSVDLS
jgi:UDP-2,3-diacylglucosamine hydrolase